MPQQHFSDLWAECLWEWREQNYKFTWTTWWYSPQSLRSMTKPSNDCLQDCAKLIWHFSPKIGRQSVHADPKSSPLSGIFLLPALSEQPENFSESRVTTAILSRIRLRFLGPLLDLFQKDKPFQWGKTQWKSFRASKRELCRDPILLYPDFEKTFKLTTDASQTAVGAVLTQESQGIDLPIAYFSRVSSAPQLNYDETGKEYLAVIDAPENYRTYLYGQRLDLACEHETFRSVTFAKSLRED